LLLASFSCPGDSTLEAVFFPPQDAIINESIVKKRRCAIVCDLKTVQVYNSSLRFYVSIFIPALPHQLKAGWTEEG
jgi:hypothetical protein